MPPTPPSIDLPVCAGWAVPADDSDAADTEGGAEAAARAAALRGAMKAVVAVGSNIRVATVDNFQVSMRSEGGVRHRCMSPTCLHRSDVVGGLLR